MRRAHTASRMVGVCPHLRLSGGGASRAGVVRGGTNQDVRSAARSLRPQRRCLLPRAQVGTGEARRLCQPAGDGVDRQAVARRAARVLAERLQRARAADGHRSLSDSGALRGISGQEHPPDFRRVRAAAAPRRRPHGDARSDRADDPADVPRPARLSSRSAAAPSAAAGCAARRSPARASRSSSPTSPPSASPAPSASRSIAKAAR